MCSLTTLLTDMVDKHQPYSYYVAIGGAIGITGGVAYKLLAHKFTTPKSGPNPNVNAPPNTVVVYQLRRGPNAPSLSPFPIKLEMYCRLAKIPYIVDCTGRFSSKGKVPWMTYNDQIVEDSEMCIDFLNKTVGVDLNSHLSKEDKAVAKMIQVMVDEHLYWTLVINRWVYYDPTFPSVLGKIFGVPAFLLKQFCKKAEKQAAAQGMGRHSKEEVYKIMMDDLHTLSSFLGDKKFMLGDHLCQADCSVFGMLCQMIYHHFECPNKVDVENEFPNLYRYILRIKDLLWEDWDACCKDQLN